MRDARGGVHQGVVAEVDAALPAATLDDLARRATAATRR